MVLRVVGILTLLYCSLSVLCSKSLLLRVDIIIPNKEGRQVCQDILDIESALSQASGIQVYQARKTLGNQKVILVLEVKDTSSWSSVAGALSKKGYELSVTPLQTCKEYAKELGLVVGFRQPSIENDTLINYFAVEFYDQGISIDNYMDELIQHFSGTMNILKNGTITAECYRYYGDLPVQNGGIPQKASAIAFFQKTRETIHKSLLKRPLQYTFFFKLMYFSPVLNAAELKWVYRMVKDEGKASVDYSLLQNFQSFTEVC